MVTRRRDPSKIDPRSWEDEDLACICGACGERYGAHSGEFDRCPKPHTTCYVHGPDVEAQRLVSAIFHVQTLLNLHITHHNEPAHAAARAFLRSLE
jgi:hypothetical protein